MAITKTGVAGSVVTDVVNAVKALNNGVKKAMENLETVNNSFAEISKKQIFPDQLNSTCPIGSHFIEGRNVVIDVVFGSKVKSVKPYCITDGGKRSRGLMTNRQAENIVKSMGFIGTAHPSTSCRSALYSLADRFMNGSTYFRSKGKTSAESIKSAEGLYKIAFAKLRSDCKEPKVYSDRVLSLPKRAEDCGRDKDPQTRITKGAARDICGEIGGELLTALQFVSAVEQKKAGDKKFNLSTLWGSKIWTNSQPLRSRGFYTHSVVVCGGAIMARSLGIGNDTFGHKISSSASVTPYCTTVDTHTRKSHTQHLEYLASKHIGVRCAIPPQTTTSQR